MVLTNNFQLINQIAILFIKDINSAKVTKLIVTIPLYQFKKSIEIFPLIKDSEI